jgi:hypothetical protein
VLRPEGKTVDYVERFLTGPHGFGRSPMKENASRVSDGAIAPATLRKLSASRGLHSSVAGEGGA